VLTEVALVNNMWIVRKVAAGGASVDPFGDVSSPSTYVTVEGGGAGQKVYPSAMELGIPTKDSFDLTTASYVNHSNIFGNVVRGVSPPTYEFLMDATSGSTLTNSGSTAGGFDATMSGMAVTVDVQGGFTGYSHQSGATDNLYTTNVPLNSICRTADRSWIFVWKNHSAVTGTYVSISRAYSGDNGWGWLQKGSTTFKSTYYDGSNTTDLSSANADSYGTQNAAQDLELAQQTGTDLSILAVSYDTVATEITFRWKQTGDPAGHTYMTKSSSAESNSGNGNIWWAGWTSNGASEIHWRYIGVIDHKLSEAEFDTLAAFV